MTITIPKKVIKPVFVNKENLENLQEIDKKIFPIKYRITHYNNLLSKDNEYAWLFEVDNAIIGQATYRMIENNTICYLMTIGVLPNFRQRGYGSQILQFIEQKLGYLRTEKIYLHVKLKNASAHGFYIKNDYKIMRIDKNYYKKMKNPEAVLFSKKIN